MKRILLTLLVIPAGLGVGMVLATFAVGAPHAVPGILMKAPEQVRNDVSFAIFVGTPVAFVAFLWIYFIRSDRVERMPPAASSSEALTHIAPEQLRARFQQKSTDELQAILKTQGQSLYPARTYQVVADVLKDRGL